SISFSPRQHSTEAAAPSIVPNALVANGFPMAGRLLMARLKVLGRTPGPCLIKRCSLGDDANKTIYNLRAEMKDHEHTLGSKMSDLEKKLSSELALVKQSFESHKSSLKRKSLRRS
ncbi:unnamed protein product, partial [Urochloa humidicola]